MASKSSSEWSFKRWLDERGISIERACQMSKMDYRTMSILVGGGQTLPSLALKVGRGLGMTPQEVKHLGKTLDLKKWGTGHELPMPAAIEGRADWYFHLNAKKTERVVPGCYWIDVGRVAIYLVENGGLWQSWMNENGCGVGSAINQLRNHKNRLAKIVELEEQMGIPPEVMRTSVDQGQNVPRLMWQIDREAVMKKLQELDYSYLAFGQLLTSTGLYDGHGDIKERAGRMIEIMKHGDIVSYDAAQKLSMALGRTLRDFAKPTIIDRKRGHKAV